MQNNYRYKKRAFTLVEIMISSTIGLALLGAAGAILLQIMVMYRDTVADYDLTQGARRAREKVLCGYGSGHGLREATDLQVNATSGVIAFKACESSDDELDPLYADVSCRLDIEKGKKLSYISGSDSGEMFRHGVEVSDFKVSSELDKGSGHHKNVKVALLLKTSVGGRTYYTEQLINTVIRND